MQCRCHLPASRMLIIAKSLPWGWREKMTAVLFTSGQEFSRERRNRHPKNLKQAVAGMFERCKKSRMIWSEGWKGGVQGRRQWCGVRARRPCPGEGMVRSLWFILKEEGSPEGYRLS